MRKETLAQARQQPRIDTGPVVIHLQAQPVRRFHAQAHGDAAAGGRVAQRIVEQVVQRILQRVRITANPGGLIGGFKSQFDPLVDGVGHPLADQRPHERAEIHRGHLHRPRLGTGQGQQLHRGACRPLGQPFDMGQRLRRPRILNMFDCAVDLQAQPRKRCTQLMRGIGDEAFLHRHHIAQAREQVINGSGQRQQFGRYIAIINGRQIVAATTQTLGQWIEHAQPKAHAQPHQQQQRRDQPQL